MKCINQIVLKPKNKVLQLKSLSCLVKPDPNIFKTPPLPSIKIPSLTSYLLNQIEFSCLAYDAYNVIYTAVNT